MSHPYKAFERTAIWSAIDTALAELERNGDVTLSTPRDYVIGYLCQQLSGQATGDLGSFDREVT